MKSMLSLVVLVMWAVTHTFANNVSVTNVSYDAGANTLTFDVSWDNSFYISNAHYTHLYVIVKYRNSNGSTWLPMYFPSGGHSSTSTDALLTTQPNSLLSDDVERFALQIRPANESSPSSLSTTATVALSEFITLLEPSFKVFAIEMVRFTSSGTTPYYLGDGVSDNRLHRGDDPSQPFYYVDNTSISVGNNADQINTTSGTSLPVSTISTSYLTPGANLMRYEISQEQYVDFLNCLPRVAQNNRTATDISGTSIANTFVMSNSPGSINRNGIRCDATLPDGGPVTFYCDLNENGIGNEIDDGQNVAANFLLPSDLMAYIDWAGLRPINEFGYELYCRGTDQLPVAGEYAWGTTEKTAVILDISISGGPDETPTNVGSNGLFRRSHDPMRVGAQATETTNRVEASSSFFGVMNLSGNVAELVIGSYSEDDFSILTSGDGILDPQGDHDESWPVNMVTKGLAPNNSTLHTVSQRHAGSSPYVSTSVRSASHGGRAKL